MKRFILFNKNGKVEMSEKELKSMLADAYKEGYIQGKIDHILDTAPCFAATDEENKKQKEFSQYGQKLVFRATIL